MGLKNTTKLRVLCSFVVCFQFFEEYYMSSGAQIVVERYNICKSTRKLSRKNKKSRFYYSFIHNYKLPPYIKSLLV